MIREFLQVYCLDVFVAALPVLFENLHYCKGKYIVWGVASSGFESE
jgi:hypothetical protein